MFAIFTCIIYTSLHSVELNRLLPAKFLDLVMGFESLLNHKEKSMETRRKSVAGGQNQIVSKLNFLVKLI